MNCHFPFALACLYTIILGIVGCGKRSSDSQSSMSSKKAEETIHRIIKLMDQQAYDSALEVAGSVYALNFSEIKAERRYLLHCLESEILYYNALFQLGAEKAEQALLIARNELRNDSLFVSNALNLSGINTENFLDTATAEERFRSSLAMMTHHNDPLYSNKAHVTSNLAQLWSKKGLFEQSDSMFQWSNREAHLRKMHRTLSINFLNMMDNAMAIKQFDQAKIWRDSARFHQQLTTNSDLGLFLLKSEIHFYSLMRDPKMALKLLEEGESLIRSSPHLTAYSQIEFLRECSEFFEDLGMDELSENLKTREQALLIEILRSEFAIKSNLINRYYQNELAYQLQEKEKKEAESRLEQERFNNRILLLLLFILLLMVFLMVSYFRLKRKSERIQIRRKQIEMQLDKEKQLNQLQFEAVQQERIRISREFHDGIAPNLSSIKLVSETLKRKWPEEQMLSQLPSVIEDTLKNFRFLLNNMNPELLLEQGLEKAMNSLLEGFKQVHPDIQFLFLSTLPDKRFLPETELHVYRIFQEALQNSLKHGRPTKIDISLLYERRKLVMQVADDGQKSWEPDLSNNGNGLRNMKKRAALIRGHLSIDANIPHGTVVSLEVISPE